jgi:drug/metabolite transporter (DMT)-like permease
MVNHRQHPILVVGILGYIIANIFWLFSIRESSGLARGAIIFSVASAVLAIIISLIFYKESVTKVQLVGICVGVLPSC